ncbi:MAG TPA: hypothetical protein VFL64_14655 [Rhizobacter sp.]|nr:hypothetical protein [Rhizobacter sp.]
MAQASFQVSTYQYYNWSSRKTGKTNLILKGGGQTCSVWFVEDPAANLPPAAQVAPNYYSFYYHHSQLPHLIDMLRNEKPITVFFNDDNGFANSRISTSDEPVGEGEQA